MKAVLAETSNPKFRYLVKKEGEIETVGGMILFLSGQHFIRTSRVENISLKNSDSIQCDMVVTTRNSVYIFIVNEEEAEAFMEIDETKRDFEIMLKEYLEVFMLAENMVDAAEKNGNENGSSSRAMLEESMEAVKEIAIRQLGGGETHN